MKRKKVLIFFAVELKGKNVKIHLLDFEEKKKKGNFLIFFFFYGIIIYW